MRTPQQRRNLIKLRDEVVKFIPNGKLDMRQFFRGCGTPSCVGGYAHASGLFPKLRIDQIGWITKLDTTFGIDHPEWDHIFNMILPNDPSWIAANITDLIESET